MTIQRFVQIWTHRYHKYSHIFKAYLLAYLAFFKFKLVKRKLRNDKPLIAIIRTEHFGDVVAAEPISRYIRSLYPNAHIVWFVKPSFHELLDFNPVIDSVFKEFCVTERRVLLETGIFDKVFELQFRNNNYCPTCQIFTENEISNSRGINVLNYFNFGSLLEVFAQTGDLILPHSSFPADDQPRLYLQGSHRKRIDSLQLQKPFIAVNCQSNYVPKDWPADRWEQLITWITANYGYQIVEIGLKSSLSLNNPNYTNLCGRLSILETAEVIARASYFIGLDSGPSHLGNATGTFGVILMGALGDFPEYNPYSGSYGRQENAVFVRQHGLSCAQLSFEFVKNEVEKILKMKNNTN